MPTTRSTKEILQKYDTLLNDLYVQPVEEEILGCFLDIQERMEAEDSHQSTSEKSNKKKKSEKENEVQCRDIRSMLKPASSIPREEHKDTDKNKNTIVID